jgi:hypothetical protein
LPLIGKSAPTQKVAVPGLERPAIVKLTGFEPLGAVVMLAVPAEIVKLLSGPALPEGEPTLPTRMLRLLFLHAVDSQAIVTNARELPVPRRAPVPLTRVMVPLPAALRNTVSPLAPDTTLPRSGEAALID